MREKTATGIRAWVHSTKAAIETLGFTLWRPIWGGQCLERPIFLIGCPRSGTSISAVLFGRHPGVANFSEAGEIWDPRAYADPEANHHWTAADVTLEDAARLHDRFEFARRVRRRKRFLNKHPRNSVRIEYLQAVFPDALFIHVIRDGRAVVRSMLEMYEREPARKAVPMGNFCKPPDWRLYLRDDLVEQSALQWREIVLHVLGKRDELGSRYHELRYEDLCQDPRRILGQAMAFAELRADEDVLARLPQQLPLQNYKWRQTFSQVQIETLARVQAPLLGQLEYDL
jgi:hypothetical protein